MIVILTIFVHKSLLIDFIPIMKNLFTGQEYKYLYVFIMLLYGNILIARFVYDVLHGIYLAATGRCGNYKKLRRMIKESIRENRNRASIENEARVVEEQKQNFVEEPLIRPEHKLKEGV